VLAVRIEFIMKVLKFDTSYIAFMGLMLALSLVLTFVEYMLPPIATLPPGVKPGLSNIVTMYCLFFMGKRSAYTVVFLKSSFVFLTKGFTAFLLSLSGGTLALTIMIILLILPKVKLSYLILSIFGAIFHNIGQIIVASFLLGTELVIFYLPILVISGVIMGSITGTILKVLLPAFNNFNQKGKLNC
jgi:heptaprenyl diphosphate synthase